MIPEIQTFIETQDPAVLIAVCFSVWWFILKSDSEP